MIKSLSPFDGEEQRAIAIYILYIIYCMGGGDEEGRNGGVGEVKIQARSIGLL